MPVPIRSQREEAETERFVSTSWSEEDDICFSSNLHQTDQTNAAEYDQSNGPMDQSHSIESHQDHVDQVQAAEIYQPYESVYRTQIYKPYRPAGIQKKGDLTRHARHYGPKRLGNPGFPTLADSYQNQSVATGQSTQNQPKRQALPHVLRVGRSDPNFLHITADEEHPAPVLQGSARLSQSFEGRKRKRDSRRSYARSLEQLELPAEAFVAL